MLVEDYMTFIPAPAQPNIIYPPSGKDNLHHRLDIIICFQNHHEIRFFGKTPKNLHEHVRAFLLIYNDISDDEILVDTFRMRSFLHTLKNSARNWLHSLLAMKVMSWNDIV